MAGRKKCGIKIWGQAGLKYRVRLCLVDDPLRGGVHLGVATGRKTRCEAEGRACLSRLLDWEEIEVNVL